LCRRSDDITGRVQPHRLESQSFRGKWTAQGAVTRGLGQVLTGGPRRFLLSRWSNGVFRESSCRRRRKLAGCWPARFEPVTLVAPACGPSSVSGRGALPGAAGAECPGRWEPRKQGTWRRLEFGAQAGPAGARVQPGRPQVLGFGPTRPDGELLSHQPLRAGAGCWAHPGRRPVGDGAAVSDPSRSVPRRRGKGSCAGRGTWTPAWISGVRAPIDFGGLAGGRADLLLSGCHRRREKPRSAAWARFPDFPLGRWASSRRGRTGHATFPTHPGDPARRGRRGHERLSRADK